MKQDWIINVLSDLGKFAKDNGMDALASRIEDAQLMAMVERRLDPCMSEVFSFDEIPAAHIKMRRNEHKPGNMAVLVQSPRTGLRTFEDALAK